MAKKSKSADKNNRKTAGVPKPKGQKAVAAPKEPARKVVRTLTNEEDKALFKHHNPKIQAQKDKVATAVSDLRALYKTAKADGFEKPDFDTATQLATPEKEAKTKAKIARQLQVAQWCEVDLGEQLDMFLEPVRIPAADRAYIGGQNAAMAHQPAKPEYDPSTEQHREYMRGYHEVQTKQLKAGIGKTEPAKHPDGAPSGNSLAAGEPIVSGLRMSRAEFARQQELAAQELATKLEAEKGAGAAPDSAFQRRAAGPS